MSTIWTCTVICGSVFVGGLLLAQSTKVSAADRAFLKMAAESDMREAHLGQMAEAQASAETVKTFGKTLDQDHTESYRALEQVASSTAQSIPKGIDVARDKSIGQLMHSKGKSFDRDFVRHEIQDHEKAIAAFKREADKGENPQIKSYAQQTLPTLEKHLHQAESLAKSPKQG